MMHIAERFAIHFASSCFITLAIFFALRFWMRKSNWLPDWVAPQKRRLLLTSGLVAFSTMILRESYDLILGNQVWYKTPFDHLSWFLGIGVCIWGLTRFDTLEE